MYNSFRRIKLIRYLVAWRVNSSLVTLPKCFAPELSYVLGTIISNRLASRDGARWQKALSPLEKHFDETLAKGRSLKHRSIVFPDGAWPVDAVFFVYPGKSIYGLGELIFWEIKLFGDATDHGFFLEIILPAMEEAGYTSDVRWNQPSSIWGGFDIQAVYAARGPQWEPIVSDGRLDLRYQASSTQWAEGLTFGSQMENALNELRWLTPFEFEGIAQAGEPASNEQGVDTQYSGSFTMKAILDQLESRLNMLAPGRRKGGRNTRDSLDEEGNLVLQKAFELAVQTPLLFNDLVPAPKQCPGRWMGKHIFTPIPKEIIPCLELASVLHIGKHTHFGCGTFTLA